MIMTRSVPLPTPGALGRSGFPGDCHVEWPRAQESEHRVGPRTGAVHGRELNVFAGRSGEADGLPYERVVDAEAMLTGWEVGRERVAEQQRRDFRSVEGHHQLPHLDVLRRLPAN